MRGGTDTGEHEELRTVDCTRRENHFLARVGREPATVVVVLDAGRPGSVEPDAAHLRAGRRRQVRAIEDGFQIGVGGAVARAVLLRDVVLADAGLLAPVEVRVVVVAGFDGRPDERLGEGARRSNVRDVQLALAPVIGRIEAVAVGAFTAFEVR